MKHPKCDGCGKPCTEHFTDDRVCQGGDGPGFYLCNRAACVRRREAIEAASGVDGLRRLYTEQRARNDKPKDSWVHIDWTESRKYHGGSFRESQIPTLLETLRQRKQQGAEIDHITIDETRTIKVE